MSLARLLATGRGKFRWRVAIAGAPYEFVSSEAMAVTAADGRERLCCIPRGRELVITERSDPIKTVPDHEGVSLLLAETRDEKLTELFYKQPTKRTWLTTSFPAGGTSMAVLSNAGWSAGDHAHLGLETTEVTTTSTGVITVTRGLWDSVEMDHYSETGENTKLVEVTDWIQTFTGRRAFFYGYGEGDDPTGDGTLIWSGIVSEEPTLLDDGVHWQLDVDNGARVLGQKLGVGLDDPLPVRGIRYHLNGFLHFLIIEHDTTDLVSSSSVDPIEVRIGTEDSSLGTLADTFFETQEEFIQHVNDVMDAAVAASSFASSPTIRAVPQDGGRWTLNVTIDAVTVRYISLHVTSPVDGATMGPLASEDGDLRSSVAGGGTYAVFWEEDFDGARTVPRGNFGPTSRGDHTVTTRKLHIGGDVDLTGTSLVSIEWPAARGLDARTLQYNVDSVDTSERSLVLEWPTNPDGTYPYARAFTGATLPTVAITRILVESGHLGDLVTTLISDSAAETNRAGAPLVTGDDFDASSFTTIVEELAAGRPVLSSRRYAIGAPIELRDLIQHEARISSVWVGFGALDGKMVAIASKHFVATDPDIVAVTVLRDDGISVQQFKRGSVKGASVKTGYVPSEDEWRGPTHHIVDVVSQSRNPLGALMKVEPRSIYRVPPGASADLRRDLEAVLSPTIGTYGYPYYLVRFSAPLTVLGDSVKLGSGVSFIPRGREMPNVNGTRDAAEQYGTVVGRTVDWQTAKVQLEVTVPVEPYAGYAPAYGVTGQTNTSGNTWDLTVRVGDPAGDTDYGAASDTAALFSAVGHKVEVYEWANASPTTVTGTVDAVSGNTVTVTFDATWTPGSSEWVLRFRDASVATADQQRYAHFAGEDGRVGFAASEPARVFSP